MKPIIFSTEMTRAILDGRKTQTRRVVSPQPFYDLKQKENGKWCEWWSLGADIHTGSEWGYEHKPKYHKGNVLYVLEAWRLTGTLAEPYAYMADEESLPLIGENGELLSIQYKWRPSIHMPKAAARIFLRVTDVRVERVQSISEDDCSAEGISEHENDVNPPQCAYVVHDRQTLGAIGACYHEPSLYCKEKMQWCEPIGRFRMLWDRINAKRGYPWESNPWCWCYEFERIGVEAEKRKAGIARQAEQREIRRQRLLEKIEENMCEEANGND